MNHIKVFILILLFFSITSCGGGSDDTNQDGSQQRGGQLRPSKLQENQNYYRSVVSTRDYAYVAVRPGIGDRSGVMIFPLTQLDLTSSQTINEANYIDLNQRTATLALSGDVLFAGGDGIKALDISDLENPVELFSLDSSASTGLKIYDNYMFSFSGFIRIFDIQDPYNPVLLGSITNAGFTAAYANNIVYASSITLPENGQTQYTYENSKIHVIDISDPGNPTFQTEISLNGEAFHLEIFKNHLIAAVEDLNIATTYLQVYSLSDPNKPLLEDTVIINSVMRAFGVNANYGVISGALSGFMFDVNALGKIEVLKSIVGGTANTGDGFPYYADVQPTYAIIPGNGYAQVISSASVSMAAP